MLHLSGKEETQIIAGGLPEIFPDDIPFPPDAAIIGSIVHNDDLRDGQIEVFFDVGLELEQLNNFYQENLGRNWNKEELFRGGFMRTPCSSENLEFMYFINRIQNRTLDINIINTLKKPQKENTIMVSLYLNLPCNFRPEIASFPILSSPPNVKILRNSGGAGEKESSADAQLKTNLDLQELIAHYAACFEREGWVENDSGKEENFVWRNWKITDENNLTWLGVLQITSLAEAGHYFASARISQE